MTWTRGKPNGSVKKRRRRYVPQSIASTLPLTNETQLHPLLAGETEVMGDRPEDIGLKKFAPKDASWLDLPEHNPELGDLLEQLRSSLETMQGNHAQVDGIDEAMRVAQVALDDMLFKHASARQYDAL